MRNIIIAAIAVIAVTGCTATERGATVGALGGAAVGAAVNDDGVEGALIGGAIGAAAGALVGRASEPGRCIYRDRYGRQYVAACP